MFCTSKILLMSSSDSIAISVTVSAISSKEFVDCPIAVLVILVSDSVILIVDSSFGSSPVPEALLLSCKFEEFSIEISTC